MDIDQQQDHGHHESARMLVDSVPSVKEVLLDSQFDVSEDLLVFLKHEFLHKVVRLIELELKLLSECKNSQADSHDYDSHSNDSEGAFR